MSSPQQGPQGPQQASPYGASYPVPTPPPSTYGAVPSGAQQPPTGPPAPGGATGELAINLRKPPGAMGMITPVVTIDGYPAQCTWGRTTFGAPVGVRRVDVAQTYMWTYGAANLSVTVEPGRTTEVYYAGPLLTFGMGGAIGTEPQKRPGGRFFVVLMVIVGVLLLLAVLAAVIGNS